MEHQPHRQPVVSPMQPNPSLMCLRVCVCPYACLAGLVYMFMEFAFQKNHSQADMVIRLKAQRGSGWGR